MQEYRGALGGTGDCAKKQGQYFSVSPEMVERAILKADDLGMALNV